MKHTETGTPEETANVDTAKKFDGRAQAYSAGRPGYGAELIDCMYNEYGLAASSAIADIGSGTGKFARYLLEKGSEVYCVEPNDDMRRMAEDKLGTYAGFHSVRGNAENTGLEDGQVDNVTAAQAFHWFDVNRFRQECLRITGGRGRVFLIWNMRNGSDLVNRGLHRIYSKYCPDFRGFSLGLEKDDVRIRTFFEGGYDYVSFEAPLYFDRERFMARSLSSSYSLKSGDAGYDEYIYELACVFDRYAKDGAVTIENSSVAYIGPIR